MFSFYWTGAWHTQGTHPSLLINQLHCDGRGVFSSATPWKRVSSENQAFAVRGHPEFPGSPSFFLGIKPWFSEHVRFFLPICLSLTHQHGGLNENVPHSLGCLDTWCPVGGAVWEGLGGAALQEEVCHWGAGFENSKPPSMCSSHSLLGV